MILTTTATGLVDELTGAADQLGDLEAANLAAADEIVGYVQPPILTGALASTVHAEADAVGFAVVAGGSDAPYAPIVHARDPFLDIAAEEREDAVVGLYEAHVQEVLDNIQGA